MYDITKINTLLSIFQKLQDISKPRPEIDRSELRAVLLNSLLPETIIWDSQFLSMEKENNGWRLHFKNETSIWILRSKSPYRISNY